MDASLVGAVIDHFRLVERLGGGGMGTVYKAVDLLLEREVALKFLRPELARQPDLAERFRAEAVILSRLTHPHIASLYSLHRHEADLFMVMEYVPGETLQAHLARRGAVPPPEAVRLAARILDALDYAHRQGVVHRDIKTANIIVTPDGTPKVMDFGIARVLGGERRTRLGVAVGTPAYMSPEQIQGLDVDGRSDLYSLGVVLYEMLAGRVPFEAESDWALMQAHVYEPPPALAGAASLPPELEHIVMRALAKAPEQRYATALHFRLALEAAMPGTIEDVRRPTPSLVVVPTVAAGVGNRERGDPRHPWHPGRVPVTTGAADSSERATAGSHETRARRKRLRPAAIVASLVIVLLAGWRAWRVGPGAPEVPGARPAGVTRPSDATAFTPASQAEGRSSAAPQAHPPAAPPPPTATPPPSAALDERALPGPPAQRREIEGRAGTGATAPPVQARLQVDGPAHRGTDDDAARGEAPAEPTPGTSHRGPFPAVPAASTGTQTAGTPAGAESAAGFPSSRSETPEAAPEPTNKARFADRAPETPPSTAAGAGPWAAAPASPVSFDRIWLLESTGDDVREVGVVLELAGDRLAILDKATREPRRTLPYHAISDMVYAQSKHPRWKAGAGAAVAVGVFAAPVFFMKNTKHWLTLQGAGEAIVLRLDKNNYRLVLPALEARTGRPVEVATER